MPSRSCPASPGVLSFGAPATGRLILQRRFLDKGKQGRIAQEVGFPWTHVSRLLTASLDRLREVLAEGK
ncbi:sigma factor-like helix-turn-helix DNA-binding protein [Nocardiopsis metallicus]|uniref:DNA-directed RNA polymerase specialized sigma subunit n=1 Tax=Nocardiopsis metallicus TaxID=179819 RepID=A0A840W1L4_9ACTN|nr:sigma factor-like helix-turn-helix DNA-binding protein [Nocardiopsis metallicus]MBB5489962.1 DNA-directed RNA polymerase specialized sigma subunit [Nocardiopsis metallicus]